MSSIVTLLNSAFKSENNVNKTYIVDSEAEMLALVEPDVGDFARRTDIEKTFILNKLPTSILAHWQELSVAQVTSVFGETGDIVAQVGQYNTDLVTEGTNEYFTTQRALDSVEKVNNASGFEISGGTANKTLNINENCNINQDLDTAANVTFTNFNTTRIILNNATLLNDESGIKFNNANYDYTIGYNNGNLHYNIPDFATCHKFSSGDAGGTTLDIMCIEASGNVSIGKTSPALSKLDIAGDIAIGEIVEPSFSPNTMKIYTKSDGKLYAKDKFNVEHDLLFTAPNLVTSVFGEIGDIVAQAGQYNTDLVTEATNEYFTTQRALASIEKVNNPTSFEIRGGTVTSRNLWVDRDCDINQNLSKSSDVIFNSIGAGRVNTNRPLVLTTQTTIDTIASTNNFELQSSESVGNALVLKMFSSGRYFNYTDVDTATENNSAWEFGLFQSVDNNNDRLAVSRYGDDLTHFAVFKNGNVGIGTNVNNGFLFNVEGYSSLQSGIRTNGTLQMKTTALTLADTPPIGYYSLHAGDNGKLYFKDSNSVEKALAFEENTTGNFDSIFGRTNRNIVGQLGDYDTDLVTEGTENQYFKSERALDSVEKVNNDTGFEIAGGTVSSKVLNITENCNIQQDMSKSAPVLFGSLGLGRGDTPPLVNGNFVSLDTFSTSSSFELQKNNVTGACLVHKIFATGRYFNHTDVTNVDRDSASWELGIGQTVSSATSINDHFAISRYGVNDPDLAVFKDGNVAIGTGVNHGHKFHCEGDIAISEIFPEPSTPGGNRGIIFGLPDGNLYYKNKLGVSKELGINSKVTKRVTANYTALSSDAVLLVEPTSGTIFITIDASLFSNETLKIKRVASAGNVTIQMSNSGNIDGSTALFLDFNSAVELCFDGINAFVLSKYL